MLPSDHNRSESSGRIRRLNGTAAKIRRQTDCMNSLWQPNEDLRLFVPSLSLEEIGNVSFAVEDRRAVTRVSYKLWLPDQGVEALAQGVTFLSDLDAVLLMGDSKASGWEDRRTAAEVESVRIGSIDLEAVTQIVTDGLTVGGVVASLLANLIYSAARRLGRLPKRRSIQQPAELTASCDDDQGGRSSTVSAVTAVPGGLPPGTSFSVTVSGPTDEPFSVTVTLKFR